MSRENGTYLEIFGREYTGGTATFLLTSVVAFIALTPVVMVLGIIVPNSVCTEAQKQEAVIEKLALVLDGDRLIAPPPAPKPQTKQIN